MYLIPSRFYTLFAPQTKTSSVLVDNVPVATGYGNTVWQVVPGSNPAMSYITVQTVKVCTILYKYIIRYNYEQL